MQLDVVEVASGVFQARTRYVAWVLVTDGTEVTLVDTGYQGDRQRVLASLDRIGRSGADVSAVVLTHAHRDHRGNARWLHDQYEVPVEVHEDEQAYARGKRVEEVAVSRLLRMAWRPSILLFGLDLSIRMRALGTKFLDVVGTFCDGPVDVPGRPVCVHTPGHTSGHVALHLPSQEALVVGDALMTEHPAAGTSGVQVLPSYFNHDNEQAWRRWSGFGRWRPTSWCRGTALPTGAHRRPQWNRPLRILPPAVARSMGTGDAIRRL